MILSKKSRPLTPAGWFACHLKQSRFVISTGTCPKAETILLPQKPVDMEGVCSYGNQR